MDNYAWVSKLVAGYERAYERPFWSGVEGRIVIGREQKMFIGSVRPEDGPYSSHDQDSSGR